MRTITYVLSVALIAVMASVGLAQTAQSLANDAMAAYQSKDFAKSAELFDQAISKGASHQYSFYNAACAHALAGHKDRAFELLGRAVDHGYREAKHMSVDSDLISLHTDPRWKAVVAKCEAAEAEHLETINAELAKITEEDQADRAVDDPMKIDWEKVSKRDAERRARVYEIIKEGGLEASEDYFNAALVLQHGDGPADYDMANKLAAKAAELDPTNGTARWLASAARDRYLWATGKPQIYGTQFKKVDGTWTIDPLDETAVTDEERRRQGVPTLAETRKRLAQMNAKDAGK